MSVIQLIHLSDIHYLADVPPQYLMEFLKEKKMHQPDALLIAGISLTGTEAELAHVRVCLNQLIEFLELPPEKIMIEPSPVDLSFGYGVFNNEFYEPIMGKPFDHRGTSIIHLPPHMQIFTLNTIPFQNTFGVTNEDFKARLATAKQQTEGVHLPPSFLRALFYYHPVMMWDENPSGLVQNACIHDHLRLSFFGHTDAWVKNAFMYSMGTETGRLHFFRYFPTQQKMFSSPAQLAGDRWVLGSSIETPLRASIATKQES